MKKEEVQYQKPVQLRQNVQQLAEDFDQISDQRKDLLEELGAIVLRQLEYTGQSKLVFVCTHNSRRSQLAEWWMNVTCRYYNIGSIDAYSGGTEATAFYGGMVDALRRFGSTIETTTEGQNPRYTASLFDKADQTRSMFSKRYDDIFNPQKDFIAVMVCDQADADCPFVPGAYARFALNYQDPKAYDGSDQAQGAYDDKVLEIGREILYLGHIIHTKTND